MQLSESVIIKKMNDILESYYSFKNFCVHSLSFMDYKELRSMAISELKEGIYDKEESEMPRCSAQKKAVVKENIEILSAPKAAMMLDDGFGNTGKEPISDDILDKFKQLKDL